MEGKILPSQRSVTLCVGFRAGLLFSETLLLFGQKAVNLLFVGRLFAKCHPLFFLLASHEPSLIRTGSYIKRVVPSLFGRGHSIFSLTLVLGKLKFEAFLRIGNPLHRGHWNLELTIANGAGADSRDSSKPFEHAKSALFHVFDGAAATLS